MVINHAYKFMFFAEPHTASRACSRMLEEVDGSDRVGPHHITHEEGIRQGRLPTRGYLRFAVIRDPRDLIASQVAIQLDNAQRRREKQAKDENAKNPGPPMNELTSMVRGYVSSYCAREVFFMHDYVDVKIRFEQLEPQLNSFLEKLGVDPIPKLWKDPKHISKGKKPWWHQFTKEQTEEIYAEIPEVEQFR